MSRLITVLVFLVLQLLCPVYGSEDESILPRMRGYLKELRQSNLKIKNIRVRQFNNLQIGAFSDLVNHIRKTYKVNKEKTCRMKCLMPIRAKVKNMLIHQNHLTRELQAMRWESQLAKMGFNLQSISTATTTASTSLTTANATTPSTPETTTNFTTSATSPTTTMMFQRQKSRLLIVPVYSKSLQIYNIEDGTRKTYFSNLPRSRIIAGVTYDAYANKLYFCLIKPQGISMSTLNSKDSVQVRTDVACGGLKVDEERRILFLTNVPIGKVSKINLEDIRHSSVEHIQTDSTKFKTFDTLDIDRRKKKVYVCATDKLWSMRYDGKQVRELYSGGVIYTVALHPGGEFLYFNTNQTIRSLSLLDGTVEEKVVVEDGPVTIQFYNESLYFISDASLIRGSVYSSRTNEGNNTLESIYSGFSSYICLIP